MAMYRPVAQLSLGFDTSQVMVYDPSAAGHVVDGSMIGWCADAAGARTTAAPPVAIMLSEAVRAMIARDLSRWRDAVPDMASPLRRQSAD
jgi:hypothetical protein